MQRKWQAYQTDRNCTENGRPIRRKKSKKEKSKKMDIIQKISEDLSLKKKQVEAAVQLLDEGNTVPFIARYRKELTSGLNDEELRKSGGKNCNIFGSWRSEEKVFSIVFWSREN